MSSLRLIELGGVLVGLALLSRLAVRLKFSPIPLYLLAGLAFGEGGILPLHVSQEFIETGAEIGIVLLLLLLGLEYSAEELSATLRQSARVGALDAGLNFTPGLLAGLVLGWSLLPAVLLGGVTYISSSGIASKLLHDMRWVGNRETPIVLTILVLEDLAMALYLPAVSALALGVGPESTIIAIVVAVASVLAILFLAVRHSRAISRILFSYSDESLLLGILGVSLLVAGVLESARGSAAVGAFLVGIAISGPAADRARPLLEPLRDLFAAVFFVFVGLEVDPRTIPSVLTAAAVLAFATAATKAGSVWWSTKRAGIGVRGRWRASSVLVARGEFSIAIAALGFASGLEPRLLPLSAAYVTMLGILGPVSVRIVSALLPPPTSRRPLREGVSARAASHEPQAE